MVPKDARGQSLEPVNMLTIHGKGTLWVGSSEGSWSSEIILGYLVGPM